MLYGCGNGGLADKKKAATWQQLPRRRKSVGGGCRLVLVTGMVSKCFYLHLMTTDAVQASVVVGLDLVGRWCMKLNVERRRSEFNSHVIGV